MAFIAGAFNASLAGAAVGVTREGFTIEWFSNTQPIVGDNFGRTPQDYVHQNIEVFIEVTLLEWNQSAAAPALFWPFNATLGAGPIVGSLGTNIGFPQLVLTAVVGTPAAGIGGEDVWTFANVQLQEGFPMRILLASTLREVVLRLRVYPSSSNVFFTVA